MHLFSGDDRTPDAKAQSIMRSSLWEQALSGSEVLVEVDVTATRVMDLNKQDAIFKVLAWAALSRRPTSSYFSESSAGCVFSGPASQGGAACCSYDGLVVHGCEVGRCKRRQQGQLQTPMVKPHVGFMLEHPEAKHKEHVSLFRTSLWRSFSLDALMGEVQLEVNGKPNLDLWQLQGGRLGAVGAQRWPLELVAHVTRALRVGWETVKGFWPLLPEGLGWTSMKRRMCESLMFMIGGSTYNVTISHIVVVTAERVCGKVKRSPSSTNSSSSCLHFVH